MNYAATVVKITNIRPHSNADRLVCTNIFGNNVIVGKDTEVGTIGLYFPMESQIGKEFAEKNDLIRRKDENGKPAGGMFDNNRRVRAQTFRGERSEGFWIPITSVANLPGMEYMVETLTLEGTEVEKLGDFVISQKYIPKTNPVAAPRQGKKPRESRIIPGQFHFHFDTEQLGKNIHKLNPHDIVVLTWKFHGTSAIASNVLTKRKLGWRDKLASLFGVNVVKDHYDYIYASRRVIKNEFEEEKQHYYDEDIWTSVGMKYFKDKLHQGETVYYEIVGYTTNGSPIQKGYDYKCLPGQCDVYVYRITKTAPDGSIVELQWNQVKDRCKELHVKHVVEIDYDKTTRYRFYSDEYNGEMSWQQQYLEFLKNKYVHDQDCQFCNNKVPSEGICLRVEGSDIQVYKLKNFRFFEQETKDLDKGEVDLETSQTI